MGMESLCRLSAAFLLLVILGHTLTVAPGDEDTACGVPDYPANIRVLLDSWRYQTLLDQNDAPWTAVNTDQGNTNTWESRGQCARTTVSVCSGKPGEKWLYTQFINKTLPAPNTYPVRIFINISYSFLACPRDDCEEDFELRVSYNGPDLSSFKDDIMPDHRIRNSDMNMNGTKHFHIDPDQSVDGFFLALKSRMKGVCVNVSRVLVYRHECPGHDQLAVGLVRRPATQAPVTGNEPVTPQCAENSNHTAASMPNLLVCTSDGVWINDQTQCACNKGYKPTEDGENCEEVLLTTSAVTETPKLTNSPQTSTSLFGRGSSPSRLASTTEPPYSFTRRVPIPSYTHSVRLVITSMRPSASELPHVSNIESRDGNEDSSVPAIVGAVVGTVVAIVVMIALLILLLFVFLSRKRRTKLKESNNQLANPVYDITTPNIQLKVASTTTNGCASDHKQEEETLYKLYNPLYTTPQSDNDNNSSNPTGDNMHFEEPQYSVPDARSTSTTQYEVPTTTSASPTQPEDSCAASHAYDYASVVAPHIAPEYAVLEEQEHMYHCLESPKTETGAPALSHEAAEMDTGCEPADGNSLDQTVNNHMYYTLECT